MPTEKYQRYVLKYNDLSDQFLIGKDDLAHEPFQRQYYFLYRARINCLLDRIFDNAKEELGSDARLLNLAELPNDGQDNLVVGVILKKMKRRPSVLSEFVDEENVEYAEDRDTILTSDEDVLEFEDDQQIVRLCGKIDKDMFVSGDVIGLYGSQERDDLFDVKTIVFPKLSKSCSPLPSISDDCYTVLASDMFFNNSDPAKCFNISFATKKFQEWVNGELYASKKELKKISNIGRMIIAGGVIRLQSQDLDKQKVSELTADQDINDESIQKFDEFISSILYNFPVDIMSGPNDPCSCFIPQQPIPKIILQRAAAYASMLKTVTNPYKFELEGVRFLGTSGQNINDLSRLTCGSSQLELMERTLNMGHLFPTVPDTLDGFPFKDKDPLIVDEIPHVYFVGNQKFFARSDITLKNGAKCLLLQIPSFSLTKSVILLNLRTFHTTVYNFSQETDDASAASL